MHYTQRLQALVQLGEFIESNFQNEDFQQAIRLAYQKNKWFEPKWVEKSLRAIAQNYLAEEKLQDWAKAYGLEDEQTLTVLLVLAGNIPLVGFHDLLCTFLSGHHAKIKYSSKDEVLIPFLIQQWTKLHPEVNSYFSKHQLPDKDWDAVIATGSNNTARYFEYYFGQKPHIFRKHRNTVAVLDGSESMESLQELGHDVFDYYGLGCRNVAKIYCPKDYDFKPLFEAWEVFKHYSDHDKYRNNYDYYKSIFLVNRENHLDNGFILLKEAPQMATPVGVLHYETYQNKADLTQKLKQEREKIQCVVGKEVDFGEAQWPQLADYADGVDTMKVLKTWAEEKDAK